MKKAKTEVRDPEMRAEYDFSGGVRGKYAARMAQGSNVVVLDRDVQKLFPDSASVNAALRALGLPGPGWLRSAAWSKTGLIMMALWSGSGAAIELSKTASP